MTICLAIYSVVVTACFACLWYGTKQLDKNCLEIERDLFEANRELSKSQFEIIGLRAELKEYARTLSDRDSSIVELRESREKAKLVNDREAT